MSMKRILVPVDLDGDRDDAVRAVFRAVEQARPFAAAIDLLYVVNPRELVLLQPWWESLDEFEQSSQSLATLVESEHQGGLNELAVEARLAGAKDVTTLLKLGDVTEVIVKLAAERDLVVMTRRPRGRLSRLLGRGRPRAERVARRTRTPTLIVPIEPAQAA
jgi:nucleotide-binding universal stress UspA family protein